MAWACPHMSPASGYARAPVDSVRQASGLAIADHNLCLGTGTARTYRLAGRGRHRPNRVIRPDRSQPSSRAVEHQRPWPGRCPRSVRPRPPAR